MKDFEKLLKDIDGLDISQVMSDADLALLFVEQVCKLKDLFSLLKMPLIELLLNRIQLVRPELAGKLREACGVLSDTPDFALEIHNSPCLAGGGGIHVMIGKSFSHRDLSEVLKDCVKHPQTGSLGGCFRDISLPACKPK